MANEKFIWEQDDIEFVDETEFKDTATLYATEISKPYLICELNTNCLLCDEDDQDIAKKLATTIYENFFKGNDKDKTLVGKVLKSYISLCQKLLPKDIVLTKQLYCCAKMHFLNLLTTHQVISEEDIKDIFKNNQ